MCGINGIVSDNALDNIYNLEIMVNTQRHRGSDETGYYKHQRCILGHNRLSIVDLDSGQQPMESQDGKYVVVFNGEIYGFREIKSSLQYHFVTDSDTEVILALYIQHGYKMLEFLPGMFSFAIWDKTKEELFFARDRVGEKPFYYNHSNNRLIFASEVDTLIKSELVPRDVDMDSIGHYLSKLYVHPNHSIYKDINSLPPASYGIFRNGKLTISKYWEPPHENTSISYLSAVEELEYLFIKSIKKQLVADVPLSVFLSGGLDSSTVAGYASKQKPSIEALCFRFESGLDEGRFASDVAHMNNIQIHELRESDHKLIADNIINSVDCFGEPFADSSSIPTMMICQEAAKMYKVVLSGDGADELFGGYESRYRPTVYMERLLGKNPIRVKVARLIYAAMNRIYNNRYFFNNSQAAKYVNGGYSIASMIDYCSSIYKDDELSQYGLKRHSSTYPHSVNSVNSGMIFDVLNYLPGDILPKTDRASMSVGLEVRSPFLDKDIVEFALGLPSKYKITHNRDKIIMRDCFEKVWPDSVKNRSKQGFGSPVKDWLLDKSVVELKGDMYSHGSRIYSLIGKDIVDHNKDRLDMRGWAMLTLAVWCDRFLTV